MSSKSRASARGAPIASADRGFWASGFGAGGKRALLACLVACFAGVTLLVYFDPSQLPPLSTQAEAGRRIWHQYNCQSCHQLYGFGGFLGPDLTNAASRLDRRRFERLLTEGSAQMPALGFSPPEVDAVMAFLRAMDQSGQGQAKMRLREAGRDDPSLRLTRAIQDEIAEAGDGDAAEGFNLFMVRGCRDCHIPLGRPRQAAPDVMTARRRLSRGEIMNMLEYGRPPAMPAPGLSPREREVLYGFLGWLEDHEYALLKRSRLPESDQEGLWGRVPWWEFR